MKGNKSYENPYTLTFEIKPDQYISRVQQTEEIIGTLQSENPSVRVYLISGVRGSSKTVLMTNVSDELKKESMDCHSFKSYKRFLHSAVEKLNAQKAIAPFKLKASVDFSLLGIGVSVEGAEKISDEELALEKLLEYAKKINKRVLFTIDEKIWQELSAIEKDILIAMTQIKSKKVKDIREVLNSKSNDFSVYRTRLIRKGVVYSPSYGELDFTLPLFDKFVLDQA